MLSMSASDLRLQWLNVNRDFMGKILLTNIITKPAPCIRMRRGCLYRDTHRNVLQEIATRFNMTLMDDWDPAVRGSFFNGSGDRRGAFIQVVIMGGIFKLAAGEDRGVFELLEHSVYAFLYCQERNTNDMRESLNPLNILRPFGWEIWLLLVSSLVIASLANSKTFRPMESFFEICSLLLRQTVANFTLVLCIWSLCGHVIR